MMITSAAVDYHDIFFRFILNEYFLIINALLMVYVGGGREGGRGGGRADGFLPADLIRR